jgi:hypothetical protein
MKRVQGVKETKIKKTKKACDNQESEGLLAAAGRKKEEENVAAYDDDDDCESEATNVFINAPTKEKFPSYDEEDENNSTSDSSLTL